MVIIDLLLQWQDVGELQLHKDCRATLGSDTPSALRRYLFKSTSAGVQDYLCNRLYALPEAGVERYLLQLGQLVLTRPHSSLERVLIDLCARSLRLAVKVHTL